MGQGQDENDEGGYTPYQPDATPDAEPSAGGAAPPYVPYGGVPNVPYGAAQGASLVNPFITSAPAKSRWIGWLVGIGVVLATCGSCIGGVIGAFTDDAPSGSSPGDQPDEMQVQIVANDLEARQCLIGAGLDPTSSSFDDGVSGLEVVDCSTAHDAEVIAVNVLDAEEAAAYDFEDSDGAFESCRPFFSPAQRKLLERDDLFLIALTESATPTAGDKVACLLTNADGSPLHGSFNDPTP